MDAQPSLDEHADPCVIVIFGASGDLTRRKLIPSLYELDQQGRLPASTCILGVSRTKMTDDQWRERLAPDVEKFASGFNRNHWHAFAQRLHYIAGDAGKEDAYPGLIKRIIEICKQHGTYADDCDPDIIAGDSRWAALPNVLFYLSVAPQLYAPIVNQIGAAGLVYEGKRWCAIDESSVPWQRIIVEKPFGEDVASAVELNRTLGRVFEEDAIYRIDHYLGKELVQNILVMRFANAIFEPTWNSRYVDHVQVTAAETVGVGKRAGGFYDKTGAMRDMIQSHLLQGLALVAMEPPNMYDAESIRSEKIKLINAVRTIDPAEAHRFGAMGRYGASGDDSDDDGGRGYADLEGVDAARATETYSAMRIDIDNWRWSGVPFYVRSGKKLASKLTEIVVQFKRPPIDLFRRIQSEHGVSIGDRPANQIIISIAPEEGISMRFEVKVPGSKLDIDSAKFHMNYAKACDAVPMDAYGPLMLDAMRGDQTLYKHRDEVEAGWRIVQPVLDSQRLRDAIETYQPGSWGPACAEALLANDGRHWHNPE